MNFPLGWNVSAQEKLLRNGNLLIFDSGDPSQARLFGQDTVPGFPISDSRIRRVPGAH